MDNVHHNKQYLIQDFQMLLANNDKLVDWTMLAFVHEYHFLEFDVISEKNKEKKE